MVKACLHVLLLASTGVKHANTVHVLELDGPKQQEECNIKKMKA